MPPLADLLTTAPGVFRCRQPYHPRPGLRAQRIGGRLRSPSAPWRRNRWPTVGRPSNVAIRSARGCPPRPPCGLR